MNQKEFESKLIKEFPTFFINLRGNPSGIKPSFGLEISEGWYDIIWRLCEAIKATNPPENFRFVQIKEKFGGLRAYSYNSNEQIEALVTEAEKEAYKTCETCGTKENVTIEGSWIRTLCRSCREKR